MKKPITIGVIAVVTIFSIGIVPYSFAHVYPDHNFAVTTDKRSYAEGDTVTISASISDWSGVSIEIKLIADSTGNTHYITNEGTLSGCPECNFSHLIPTEKLAKLPSGDYTVIVTWHAMRAETTFTFENSDSEESTNSKLPLERGPQSILTMDIYGNSLSHLITNEKAVFTYGVGNSDSLESTIEIEIFINFHEEWEDDGKQILYEKLIEKFEPGESKSITWSFVPEKEGKYSTTIIPEGQPSAISSFTVEPPSESDIINKIKRMPPHKQISEGILPENVMCKSGMDLIFKSTDGSPACVTKSTAPALIERGWAKS